MLFNSALPERGMAKQGSARRAPENERRKEGVIYGLLVCTLGSIWLAQEMGVVETGVPIGPIIIIVVGFLMMLPWLDSSKQ
jgi:hypothetical protein